MDVLFVPSYLPRVNTRLAGETPALLLFRCLLLCRSLAACLSPRFCFAFGRRGLPLFANHGCDRRTVLVLFRQRNLDMRDAADITICASHRRGTDALHARTVVRNCPLHVEIVD